MNIQEELERMEHYNQNGVEITKQTYSKYKGMFNDNQLDNLINRIKKHIRYTGNTKDIYKSTDMYTLILNDDERDCMYKRAIKDILKYMNIPFKRGSSAKYFSKFVGLKVVY